MMLMILSLQTILHHLPVADPPVLDTCIVILVDDGLLRTSTGFAGPSSSLTLYDDWLKLTVMAIRNLRLNTTTNIMYFHHSSSAIHWEHS